jgi:transcriptional regulator with XRE-family HTH domain
MLVLYRQHYALSVRACAKQMGLTPATLSRVERGLAMTHTTYQTLLNWLGGPEGDPR